MPRRRQNNTVDFPRDPGTEDRIATIVESTTRRHRLDGQAQRWRPYAVTTADAVSNGPVLSLDDYSEIPFLRDIVGAAWYQYRARLRCGDGDLYIVARPAIDGYEAYNREYLGLGRARLVRLDRPAGSELALGRDALDDPACFAQLTAAARKAGGLLVHPYMGVRPVWDLAEALQHAAGVPVRVLAPPPHITALANDKARFSEIVQGLLGDHALARTAAATDPAAIAEHLRDEARRSPAVALKMSTYASGMGNRIFDSATLRDQPPRAVRAIVDRFLDEKEWDGRVPVLVVQWHRDVLESPSTQCWIPPLGAGEPRVEEVFQQFLQGDEQVFEGAMLSGLPRRIRHDFMVRSWLICRVLQALGYAGRCSFDALVVGNTLADASLRFVECNGRWGGTSNPMHLMKRVFGDFRHRPYKAQDYVDERLIGLDFHDLMDVFDGQLYDRRTGRGRVLLYNVGGVGEHGKFDLIVTGRTFADVQRFITDRIPALVSRKLSRRGRHRPAKP